MVLGAPGALSLAEACCDRWADGSGRLALLRPRTDAVAEAVSFDALHATSCRVAQVLRAQGIGRGDRVAILLPQGPEAVIALLAAWRLGAIAVPLARMLDGPALAFRLDHSGAVALVTDDAGLGATQGLRAGLPALRLLLGTEGAQRRAPAEVLSFWAEAGRAPGGTPGTAIDPADPALILYTTGGAGPPRGVLHAHRALAGHLPGVAAQHGGLPQPGDRVWTPMDWAWRSGLFDAVLPALCQGVPVLAAPMPRFDAGRALDLMARHGVRNAVLPTAALRALREAVAHRALRDALPERALHDALPKRALHDALPKRALHDALPERALHDALPERALHDALPERALRDALPERALRDALPERALHDALPQRALRDAAATHPSPPRLRSIATSGAPPDAALADWAAECLGARPRHGHGATECNLVLLGGGDPAAPAHPVPGQQVAVVDAAGTPLPAGQAGILAVRRGHPAECLGYWRAPTGRPGAWLPTGDRATRLADGAILLDGAGAGASGDGMGPEDVEHCLRRHPAVALAAVVGPADALAAEDATAIIVPHRDATPGPALAEELRDFMRLGMAGHRYPRRVAFAKALPRAPEGRFALGSAVGLGGQRS
ncbi:AMP-binding protein [Roseomonas sp. CECT 9278]|uniref:AMP-binding protein n=1 Tax=Roseomonas sp. CECT 9278 TaxID=2845823 RepID=UPI001E408B19|nr:AMP-binding protein [Roseomonas sp. CECT 9278]CAH0173080.1 Acetyl-coenzyme A synthetase [Roseomonas sp. CECT 9278]